MQIRVLEGAADTERLREGFRQVFGGDISAALLHWKYGDGRGRCWGAFADDGALLAHCGVTYREVLADGQRRRIAQLGDLLATPARQDGLSRRHSAFFLLIDAVLDSLSDALNPDALCFGFPSERAMRLGERLGVFASIDRIHELTLSPLMPAHLPWWRLKVLSPDHALSAEFGGQVDRLWQRMARVLGRNIVGVRDAAYLRHRYVCHPEHAYTLALVRPFWGAPTACVVLRKQGADLELMDVVGAPHDLPMAIQVVRRHLDPLGANALKLWLTQSQLGRLPKDVRGHAVPLQFRIMANPRSSAGQALRFADRWWLTSGDTDYR